VRYQL